MNLASKYPPTPPAPPVDRRCRWSRVEVEKRTGLGKTTIYDRISAGTFPAQIKRVLGTAAPTCL
ncbi:TPA: helix-turn-helix transcriptional regulator [Stenotrophomonas maltophilia]